MKKRLLFCFWNLLFMASISAAEPPVNPLTADAGDDLTICAPGQSVTLNGSVAGLYSSISWEPSAGMSDPTSLNPEVYVSSTTTFTLNVVGSGTSSNLITNGDFSAGHSGFTSAYVIGTGGTWGPLSNEGTYEISTNSSLLHTNWASCTDHTGGGNMMVVNGAATPNVNVWCQTVTVTPNTIYEFGAWLTSVHPAAPAILQFSINGVLLGSPFGLSGSTCTWEEFFETWDSGGNSSAEICIVNQNTEPSGNDFAIDDITFGPVCTATDEVTVTMVDVFAVADPIALIPCNTSNGSITLSGVGSTVGPDVSYQWTTSDGNIVSGANTLTPTVDAAGLYELTVSINSSFGPCTATALVEVQNEIPPEATAETSNNIDCLSPLGTVSGVGSTVGGTITYLWTTLDGNIATGANEIIASVVESGTYTLLVTDILTGCTDEASTVVIADLQMPSPEAIPDGSIDCINSTVNIDGAGSSGGPNLSFEWSTQNGNIISPTNAPNIDVDSAGVYELILTNDDNGCTASVLATVDADQTPPIASIEPPASIGCSITSVTLDGTGSSGGPNLSYEWSTQNGNIIPPTNGSSIEVDEVGLYELTLTNDDNGCTASGLVTVEADQTPPNVSIDPPPSMGCVSTNVLLDASGSTGEGSLSFSWSTSNGNIVTGMETATPEIDQPGEYEVLVTDSSNGCTATASVLINSNVDVPIISIADPFDLNCNLTEIILDGSGSAPGVQFSWATQNGNIASGIDEAQATVDAPGIYQLVVTNPSTGCTNSEEVEVNADLDLPIADAGLPLELTCTLTSIELDGSASSQNGNFTYLWTSINGNIVSGENTLVPVVDEQGNYTLTVTNNDNGCENSSNVDVGLNGDFPNVNAGPTGELTCTTTEISLVGNGDSGSQFLYQWTSNDGLLLAGANSLTPVVGAVGTYTLTITNQDNGCSSDDEVTISENTNLPMVDPGPTAELSCTLTELSLSGSGSSTGNNVNFLWTTQNGNILSGENTPNPIVNATGTYTFIVLDNDNGCSDSASVVITQDVNVPIADAGSAPMLTCAVYSILLDGGGSSSGNGIIYEWSTQTGNIVLGENTLIPQVDEPGTYLLTVTDVLNDCQSFASVIVEEDTAAPDVDAGPEGLLTCTTTFVNLDGTASASGPGFSYFWETQNGNLLSGENTPTPMVDAPGIYQLTVTNQATGCTNSAEVSVDENTGLPILNIEVPALLTCETLSLNLDASSSSNGPGFTYQWTTADGNIIAGANSLNPEVNLSGLYNLLIINDLTGCEESASVLVSENTELPIADAGQSFELNCDVTSLALDGTASSMGTEFTYAWTTSNGNLLSGTNSLTPIVDAAGTYILTVFNDDNGCISTSEVEVGLDEDFPTINILPPAVLTCLETVLNLDASNSSIGSAFEYEWNSVNGNIVSGQNSLQPTIDAPGEYVLSILNSENGCESVAAVTVVEEVELPIVEAGNGFELHCNMTAVTLQGSTDILPANISASWNTANGNLLNGAQSLNPQVDAPGGYELTVTNLETGCSNTDNVLVTEIIFAGFNLEVQSPGCLNPTGLIQFIDVAGGQSPYQYSLDNGQSFTVEPTFANLSEGLYEVLVQDGNGCELTDLVYLSEPPELLVFLEAQVLVNLGESYLLNAQTSIPDSEIASVTWFPSETLSCSDCLAPLATPLQATTYQVEVTSEQGCMATAHVNIQVRKNVDIYVPNAFSPNGDGINDVFMIFSGKYGVAGINSFQVFDRWGESVFEYYDFQPNDPQYGWNGLHKDEQMNPAVFAWFAEVELIDGSSKLLKGDVTLMK